MAGEIPIPTPTAESTIAVTVAIAGMLAISAGIGLYYFKKAKNFDEWMVGHRDMGPVITGFALTATFLSGWAIFGNAGLCYTYGWSGSWLIGTMNLMGLSLCVVLGYRMRRYAALGARTVPEAAKLRFDSRLVQGLAGITMAILLLVYCIGQFKAMASVWKLTTGTDWLTSLVITAILCATYIAIGGYAGTNVSVAIQGAILTLVGIAFGIASIFWAGGPSQISSAIANATFVKTGGSVTSIPIDGYTAPIGVTFAGYDYLGVVAAMFMFVFMASGFPHNLARFIGVKKVSKKDYKLLMGIVIVGCLTPLMIGAMGLAARSVWGAQLMSSGPIFGDAAAALVSMAVGGSVGGAIFAMAVFSAAISTLAGMVMIMATNMTRDIIGNARPQISSRLLLSLSRLLVIPFVIIPLWWTYTAPPPVLSEFMSGSAVAQGGIFFFVIAVSMYWKRATKWGAVATILYGMGMALMHPAVYGARLPPFNSWSVWALTLMFGCAAIYFIVSLLTKPVPDEKLKGLFDKP